MQDFRRVLVDYSGTLDKNDRQQWLAGGELRESTHAGGDLWSPTGSSNTEILKPDVSKEALLMNGNILSYLDAPRNKIQGKMEGKELGTIYEDSTVNVNVISVTVDVTSPLGSVITKDGEFHVNELGAIAEASLDNPTLQSTISMLGDTNMTGPEIAAGLLGSMLTSAPIGSVLGVSLYNALNGRTERISQVIGQYAVNQTLGMITKGISTMATNVLGTVSPLGLLSVTMAVSALVTEAFEVMVGLDNHFGFGGQFLGSYDDKGNAQYGREKSFKQGLRDLMPDTFLELTNEDILSNWEEAGFTGSEVEAAMNQADLSDYADNPQDIGAPSPNAMSELDAYNLANYGTTTPTTEQTLGTGGEGNGGDGGFGNDSPGDQGRQGGDRQGGGSSPDGSSSDNDSGGTYCCTAMNRSGKWQRVRTVRMEKWHKTQPKWWILGYNVWGKIVAKHVVKDGSGYGGSLINAFYDSKVKDKRPSLDTYMSYLVIYPGALVCGIYQLSANKVAKCYNYLKQKE